MKNKEKIIFPKQTNTNYIFECLELFVVCTCAVIILFSLGIRMCVVDGDSMKETLENGDVLITTDIMYEPKQGDVVVFHLSNEYYNRPLIKRVIATEGQWIDIKKEGNSLKITIYEADDTEFANPIVYEDEYAYYSLLNSGWAGSYDYPVQVPEGKLFVMGDNRWDSSDSRSERVGFIDERIVFGKVAARVWPLSKVEFYS